MQQQEAQDEAEASPVAVFVIVQQHRPFDLAEAHATVLRIKMPPDIHEIFLASAHAPLLAPIVGQPSAGTAPADAESPAQAHVQKRQKRNIDAKADLSHRLTPSLRVCIFLPPV